MSLEMQPMSEGQKKILFVLAFLIAIVLIHLFVVQPMREKTASVSAQARDLNAETDRRIRMVKKITPMRSEIASLKLAIQPITNQYVLYRELGSYPIQRNLYEYATNGLKIVRFNEIGRKRIRDSVTEKIQSTSQRKSKNKQTLPSPFYDRYQVEVSLKGSYASLMQFLRTMEKDNPLFSVVSLDIIGNKSSPEVHDILMTLEWPVDAPVPKAVPAKK